MRATPARLNHAPVRDDVASRALPDVRLRGEQALMGRDSREAGIPLIVGVTGHRDPRPEQCDALTARVREVLTDLRRRCPSTRIVVLSGLAEGADHLVARVALELQLELVAVLPMPRTAYEDDFPDAASRAVLADLLGKADRCIE